MLRTLCCPFLLAYACFLLAAAATDSSAASQYKNIFILAGQSNMAGRGGVVNDLWDGVVPQQCSPNAAVLRLAADLSWVVASEPLHADIDVTKTCGVGPGMAFANGVLAADQPELRGASVGLVPCAVGGTNISEWRRGRRLYGQMVRRTKAALADGGGTLRAVLWYQGESDTKSRKDAAAYGRKMEELISDLRSDLQSPMLPVFQVALASGQGPYVEMVRKAQLGINLPNVRTIDAKGLQLGPDGLHLSTPAQVQLGQTLAHSFLQAVSRPSSLTGPSPLRNEAPKRLSSKTSNSSSAGPISTFLLSILLMSGGWSILMQHVQQFLE